MKTELQIFALQLQELFYIWMYPFSLKWNKTDTAIVLHQPFYKGIPWCLLPGNHLGVLIWSRLCLRSRDLHVYFSPKRISPGELNYSNSHRGISVCPLHSVLCSSKNNETFTLRLQHDFGAGMGVAERIPSK